MPTSIEEVPLGTEEAPNTEAVLSEEDQQKNREILVAFCEEIQQRVLWKRKMREENLKIDSRPED